MKLWQHILAKTLLSMVAVAAVATASAQGNEDNVVISPQSIVVNPSPSFDVQVFTDKDTSGDASPVYNIGESIRVGVTVSEDAYVYLFSVHSDGTIDQILPNNLTGGSDTLVRAGSTRYFPPQDARYTFDVAGPQGLDKVIAVASRNPLDLSTLQGFSQSGDFSTSSQGEDSFAQTLSIVVSPIAQEDWVTDTALFYVGTRPSTPAYGTISITSNPSGAAAYVDGSFVGYTPVRFGTRTGQHTVRVERSGYQNFETTISLSGSAVSVDAALSGTQPQPTQPTGSGAVFIQSNVGGAEVFIDGTFVGNIASGSGQLRVNSVAPGSHTLRITAPGFSTVERTFNVASGQTTRIDTAQRQQ